MKNFRSVTIVILSLLLFSCNKGDEYFHKLYQETDTAYYGSNRLNARLSLLKFIQKIEECQSEIEERKIYNYNVTLGDAWLKLANIYESEGGGNEAKIAIRKAVYYFNKSNLKTFEKIAETQKEEYLWNMLKKIEQRNLPERKKLDVKK